MTNNDSDRTTRPILVLGDFIHRATLAYRKDAEAVSVEDVGNVRVVTVNGYPEAPSHGVLVDVHFLQIGFTEEAAIEPAEFLAMIEAATEGEFANLTMDDLAGGPSYITTGAWLGSQDLALRFIALGNHYGLWDVVTPERLGATGEQAAQLAGGGLVMNAGLKRPEA